MSKDVGPPLSPEGPLGPEGAARNRTGQRPTPGRGKLRAVPSGAPLEVPV